MSRHPICLAVGLLVGASVDAAELEVTRGAPSPQCKAFYMPDARHYFVPAASPATLARYAYPVNRGSYLRFMRKHGEAHPGVMNHFNPSPTAFMAGDFIERSGAYACQQALPTLVEYVVTGDKKYAPALNRSLVAQRTGYKTWDNQYVPKEGKGKWVGILAAPSTLWGWIIRRELQARKALTPEADKAFREGVVYLLEHLHEWDTVHTHQRGPHHRATKHAWLARLAVKTWPNLPQAKAWTAYEQTVWGDFWPYRDYPTNDTGYTFGILEPHLLGAEIAGMKAMFTDPQMMKVWERLLYTTCPDGSVIPYGAHGGWNSSAGERMWMFELIARHTRDGRFRWAAQRIFQYMTILQEGDLARDWGTDRSTYWGVAAAYFFADEGVKPVAPDGASRVLMGKEVLRVRDKKAALRYLKPFALFDHPHKGGVDCNMILTNKVMPHKVVFSSGTQPGDLYMLVDAFPRHDPLNPTAILGLVQYGSTFTQTISAKGRSGECRIQIEDVGHTAKLVRNTDPNLVDEYYMTVTVKPFRDHKLATHAVVNVTDYMGFPVDLSREFLFVKNRMVVVRDVLRFKDTFRARIAPVWNTQNVGPQVGPNWANTFMSTPNRSYLTIMQCPPRDLLVYHAPRPDRRLVVNARPESEARLRIPYGLRYQYDGIVKQGSRVHFSQLLVPHKPVPPYKEPVLRVRTLADTDDLTAFAVDRDKDRVEIVVLNTPGALVTVGAVKTDARQVYLDVVKGAVSRALAIDGRSLLYSGKKVFQQPGRGTYEKAANP